MARQPEVTVVIPTRNRWPLLSTVALTGALRQEDVALEVIVVDDGSSDETPAGLAALEDPRLRVLQHERSLGPASARNAGIAAAGGEWLAFLDDDDLWSPRKLRAQLDTAKSAGADFVYAAAIVVDARRTVLYSDPLPDPSAVASQLKTGNVIGGGGSNPIAKTELVRRLGGFDEGLSDFEDWDLWLRLATAGKVASCSEVLVARVEHQGNQLFRDRRRAGEEYDRLVACFDRLLEKHNPTSRPHDDLRRGFARWIADEHHRAGHRIEAARLYLRVASAHRSRGSLVFALGALFGKRGMDVTRRVAAVARGKSITTNERFLVAEPAWLELYR